MKITLAVAVAAAPLAGLALTNPDGTTGTAAGTETEGRLRLSILNTDGSVVATQDIDDSASASEAVFPGVAAGTYVASAQRLTADGALLGTALAQTFTVADTPAETPAAVTVRLPQGITVTVDADDAPAETPAA